MIFDNKEIEEFFDSIRFVYGYDFSKYSEASIKRRITHFMKPREIEDLHVLGKLLIKDEKLFEEFIQELSVTVTEMFRDPSFYKSLREVITSRLSSYPFIKIWIAGCATGEEVYSISIMLQEEGLLSRSLIYATDINQHSLQIAKDGIYPVDKMKDFTKNYQKAGGKHSFSDYYKSKYNSVMFDNALKQNVVFSPHNLAVDMSFNEFQLVICRNVLIYFNQDLQNHVINLFYDSLCPFGVLALGNKESLLFSDKKKNFDDIDKKERIFIKAR
jgi:chemotaxis protein methyltransferase CheR